jgi:hypothetical protein
MPPDVPQLRRLIVLTLLWRFPLAPPGATRERRVNRKRGNCGREMTANFADKWRFRCQCRDLLHAANLRHGNDCFTSPLKEGTLMIFSPWNIRRLRPGSNPRTWVPEASEAALSHPLIWIHPFLTVTTVFFLFYPFQLFCQKNYP